MVETPFFVVLLYGGNPQEMRTRIENALNDMFAKGFDFVQAVDIASDVHLIFRKRDA